MGLLKLTISGFAANETPKLGCNLTWMAKHADIVELIYALHHCRCFGDTKLKSIVAVFEKSFNIEIKNFSHTFGRIRIRKNDRCTFLSKLLNELNGLMEEID